MEAKELRIGNYVYLNGSLDQITSIDKEGVEISQGHDGILERMALFDGSYGTIEPIPLTKEWLEKSVFERSGSYHVKDQVYIYDQHGFHGGTLFEYRYNYTSKPISYVHELQNLFFALTGKELAI